MEFNARLHLLQLSAYFFCAVVATYALGLVVYFDIEIVKTTLPVFLVCLCGALIIVGASLLFGGFGYGFMTTVLMLFVIQATFGQFSVFFYVLAIISGIYICHAFYVSVDNLSTNAFIAGILAAVAALGCFGAYTSFDMWHKLLANQIQPDTFFHASLAAMLKNYGVVSTGIHGLIETPYHVFSHRLFAAISLLSGVPVIVVYGVAPWILFAPLLVLAVVAAARDIGRLEFDQAFRAWLIVCVILAISPILFWKWAVWDSYFVSESYLVALTCFVFALPILFLRELTGGQAMLAAILGILAFSSKASVGLVFVGLWSLGIFFFTSASSRARALIVVIVVALYGLVSLYGAAVANMPKDIVLLAFIRTYSLLGRELSWAFSTATLSLDAVYSVLLFYSVHFLYCWICLLMVSKSSTIQENGIEARTTILVLGSVGIGVAATVLLNMPGGAVYYFSNVATFVALPPLVAALAACSRAAMKNVSLARIFDAALYFGVVVVFIVCGHTILKKQTAHHAASKQATNAFINTLVSIRDKGSLNMAYQPGMSLDSYRLESACWVRPFIYSAVSERVWVGTIKKDGSCNYVDYGFPHYGIKEAGDANGIKQEVLLPGMKVEKVDI